MKLLIELRGAQTETHCSAGSSIGACEQLNRSSERCLLFKVKLDYDFDAHAFKRCEGCLECSYVG